MRIFLGATASVYILLGVLQASEGHWALATADGLIAYLAVGWWFTLRQASKDEAEYRRLRVKIDHVRDQPTQATVYYDDVPIFAGRDYSADIMRGDQ